MGIDYSGMMIIGVDYDELPLEVLLEIKNNFGDDIYKFMEAKGLDSASLWYDADTDGMIIGKSIDDVYKKDLDTWVINVKKTFDEVEGILKVKCKLIGTQNIY